MGNDSEILAAWALETRFETLVHVSQAIAAHRDRKELFGVLVNELHRVVQFDFIGVSFRDSDSDTFQNYFIDMASRAPAHPKRHNALFLPTATVSQQKASTMTGVRSGYAAWPFLICTGLHTP